MLASVPSFSCSSTLDLWCGRFPIQPFHLRLGVLIPMLFAPLGHHVLVPLSPLLRNDLRALFGRQLLVPPAKGAGVIGGYPHRKAGCRMNELEGGLQGKRGEGDVGVGRVEARARGLVVRSLGIWSELGAESETFLRRTALSRLTLVVKSASCPGPT